MKVKHPEFVLAGATAVCLPMVPGLLAGQITAATAGQRFLIALIVCWFLGSLLSWVLNTYSEQARRTQLVRMIENDSRDKAAGPSGPAGVD